MNSSNLKDRYISWIKTNAEFNDIDNNVVRIDLPFRDNLSDNIVMYAIRKANNLIMLTDDGWTMDNLHSIGININRSPKRKSLLYDELKSFGVSINDEGELYIQCSIETFPENKHKLLQAILFVNDMFMLSSKNTSSIFIEDMSDFLSDNGIRFITDVSFTGESGLIHKFDFSIAGNKKISDKLIKTMSAPNNSMYAKSIVTDITQVQLNHTHRSVDFYVFLQDHDKNTNKKININDDILKLFKINNIIPVPFSQKNDFVDKLAE